MTRGLCECGCGEATVIPKYTDRHAGRVKGQPMRFVRGHNGRVRPVVDPEQRFWAKVVIRDVGECWPWMGTRTMQGYGHFHYIDRDVKAHRFAWGIAHGPIPDGLHVLHRCDNPPCCNPSHLFLGTNADNVADKIRKGRAVHPPHRFGQDTSSAKLTEGQARAILAAEGQQVAIAQAFGVSQPTVSYIKSGRRWPHLQGGPK